MFRVLLPQRQLLVGIRPAFMRSTRVSLHTTSQFLTHTNTDTIQKSMPTIQPKQQFSNDTSKILSNLTLGNCSNTKETSIAWRIQSQPTLSQLPKLYSDLSKDKLTAFVVLTAMAGYAIAPGAAQIAPLLWTGIGTTLCAASANSFNQWIEAPYDAQMQRTRNRPLARHALSPPHALLFGITSGTMGTLLLAVFVNPLTAGLGFANIVLYAGVYTAMKRLSVVNTWAGSLVGAIPPLMGWAAATNSLGGGALVLGAMLFAWQFPHFNSLSYTLRADYSKAGFRMMSVTRPRLNARVSLRYALLMFPLSAALPLLGVTDYWFLLDSSAVNAYMAYCAVVFWRKPDARKSRRLFFSSIAHLPVLLILIMAHKFLYERQQVK